MADTYDGDPGNYPTTLTVLTDGDAPTEAAWLPAVEGLADRTANIKDGEAEFSGEKVFQDPVELAEGMRLAGAIIGTTVPGAGGIKRVLLVDLPLSNVSAARLRIYTRATGTLSYPSPGLDITTNAQWNETTDKWVADATSGEAKLYELLSVPVGWSSLDNLDGDPGAFTMHRKGTTTTPWDHDAWDSLVLSLNASNPAADSDVTQKNTLYSKGLTKAWGVVAVTGAPGSPVASIVEGLGLDSVVIDSGTLLVTLRRAMASTNYAVVPGMIGQQAIPNLSIIESTTQFRIQFRTPASGGGGGLSAVDPLTNNVSCSFIVMGAQS